MCMYVSDCERVCVDVSVCVWVYVFTCMCVCVYEDILLINLGCIAGWQSPKRISIFSFEIVLVFVVLTGK